MLIWNCHGFQNVRNLDSEQQNSIQEAQIICLIETWLWRENSENLPFTVNYTNITQLAAKDFSKGRGSGGIIIYIKKDLKYKLIEKCDWWVAYEISTTQTNFTIICVYFKPNMDMAIYLDGLAEMVNELLCEVPERKIIIAGDFNARIGNLNSFTLDKQDDDLYGKWYCDHERISRDEKITHRGTQLTTVMENLDFFVVNGRSTSDKPAQFTFNGFSDNTSIVDLIWANNSAMEEILDLKVTNFVLSSDHLPVLLTIQHEIPTAATSHKVTRKNTPRFKWTPTNLTSFHTELTLREGNCKVADNATKLAKNFTGAIQEAAKNAGMTKLVNYNKGNNKPWYNEECMDLKRQTYKSHRDLKNGNYKDDLYAAFNETRKKYKVCLNKARKDYYTAIQCQLSNVKSSADFWSAIKLFRNQATNRHSPITMETWENFLEEEYAGSPRMELLIPLISDTELDRDFTLGELETALARSKPGKAPGPDGINNDFLKNLTANMQRILLTLYNKILAEETLPTEWAISKLFLIHKKGDKDNPMNYRGIALLNNILKILTNLITLRLQDWVEERSMLTNSQFGFRRGRGCQEAIYTLYAAISINLRLEGRKVFAIFVDFRRAFDSVPHGLLWEKLAKLNISKKIITLLSDLYSKAKLKLEINGEESREINIGKGVLQGESASPLLFNLFINDLTEYLRAGGVRGIPIDNKTDIGTILYADDLVILTDTQGMAQKALNLLAEYCQKNQISVNEDKTKAVIFRRGGRLKVGTNFSLRGKEIKIVNEFTYLGVTFSYTCLFHKAAEQAKKKARTAIGNIHSLTIKSKLQSWEARERLYKSSINAVLLYAAEIWALRYHNQLETILSAYLKRTFNWLLCTPEYMIRMEAGYESIEAAVLDRTIKWWNKLENMDGGTLPRICYNRLKNLDSKDQDQKNSKYNWVTQLRVWLSTIQPDVNMEQLRLNPTLMEELRTQHRIKQQQEDRERSLNSTYNQNYQLLINDIGTQDYLKKEKFSVARVLSQLRLTGDKLAKITLNGMTYKWRQDDQCTICNMLEAESLAHMLMRCPIYQPIRSRFLTALESLPNTKDLQLWKLLTEEKPVNIFYFLSAALKLRSFSLNI